MNARPDINLTHDEIARSGPLTRYEGREPPAPAWFARAVAHAPERFTAHVGAVKLNGLRWGDPSKPGLVLVHGNGAHAWWWAFVAPYLAETHYVAAFDLSGMGDSDWRPEGYGFESFMHEPIAVAEACGMFDGGRKPTIVGHSFGGFVTLLAGGLYADRLSGVVTVDSPVNPPHVRSGPPERPLRPHRVYPTLQAALTRFRLSPDQPCENDYLVDYVGRRSLKEVEGGWSWKFDPALWQRFMQTDMPAALRGVGCRMIAMRGDGSELMTAEVEAYMRAQAGDRVGFVTIPEARHHVMLDQPLGFVAALRAVLADWDVSRPVERR